MDNLIMVDEHLTEIKSRLDSHAEIISKNSEKIDSIHKTLQKHVDDEDNVLKEIKADIDPWNDLAGDIAAVGRFGGYIKKFGLWVAGIVAAFVTIGTALGVSWEWLEHLRNK